MLLLLALGLVLLACLPPTRTAQLVPPPLMRAKDAVHVAGGAIIAAWSARRMHHPWRQALADGGAGWIFDA
eukprot:1322091-Prymnesium_polylepis.1